MIIFKKSKKKQLAEIKYELFLLRDGLGTQKEHAIYLAETYGNKENFAKTIEGIYDSIIAKIKAIEKTY